MSTISELRVNSQGAPRNSEASRRVTPRVPQARYAGRWLLIAPLVLIGATYAVFSALMPVAGERITYFAGFGFYWLLSGIVLPTVLIGRDGMRSIFSLPRLPVTLRMRAALALLAVPVIAGFLFVFPTMFPVASSTTLVGLAAYALVNGTCEEIFWRGAFARQFPSNRWLGVVYPAVVFSFWHLVPWAIFPMLLHVPALAVLAVVLPIALLYNWVAWSTGSIHWTVLSHVLTNMSGLGAMLIFGPGW